MFRPLLLSQTLSPAVIQPHQAHHDGSDIRELICEVMRKYQCDDCLLEHMCYFPSAEQHQLRDTSSATPVILFLKRKC